MSILNKAAAPNDENNDDGGARRSGGGPGSSGGSQSGKASQVEKRKNLGLGSFVLLGLGAFVFLFPFYYMFIGSLQTSPDTSVAGAFPNPANLTGENYTNINNSITLLKGRVNSGIFTGGGGPDGASTSPVFLMYQMGILQGNPDVAAALGVVLVIGVLLIALIQKRLVGGKED